MHLEEAIITVKNTIDGYEQRWDEDYNKITQDDIIAFKVAMRCMKSVWYAKQAMIDWAYDREDPWE